jgi:hypothetical protein
MFLGFLTSVRGREQKDEASQGLCKTYFQFELSIAEFRISLYEFHVIIQLATPHAAVLSFGLH